MVRYKIVPEPPADLGAVATVQRAVPLVPASVEECCTRIRDRAALPGRDDAREWLTLLVALGLAVETGRGYRRTRTDPEPASLAAAFREQVFPAEEALATIEAGGAQAPAAVFEGVRGTVPQWERDRYRDWEGEWRERITRLLEWAALLGLVERTDEGYRAE